MKSANLPNLRIHQLSWRPSSATVGNIRRLANPSIPRRASFRGKEGLGSLALSGYSMQNSRQWAGGSWQKAIGGPPQTKIAQICPGAFSVESA